MKDRQETWSEITLANALSVLAFRSTVVGLTSPVWVALDGKGVLLYLPTPPWTALRPVGAPDELPEKVDVFDSGRCVR